jgi:predicted nucleotide-binding protein
LYDNVVDDAMNSAEIKHWLDGIAGGSVEARAQMANDLRAALLLKKPELKRVVEVQQAKLDSAQKSLEDGRHAYLLEHYDAYRELDELLQRKLAEAKEATHTLDQIHKKIAEAEARLVVQQVDGKEQVLPRRSLLSRLFSSGSKGPTFGGPTSGGLEDLRWAYEKQLERTQEFRRAVAQAAMGRKTFELKVQRELENDPGLVSLAENARMAYQSFHKALLEEAVLPYARSWVEEYSPEEVMTLEAVTNEAEGDMMHSEGQSTGPSLATVRDETLAVAAGAPGPGDHRSVFLVHGRDLNIVRAMRALLRALGLRVVEWEHAVAQTGQAAPFTGDVVLAGMQMADAVLVLLTPDDMAQLRPNLLSDADGPDEREVRGQARSNVIYEAGIADTLDRSRTLIVEMGRVKSPSDLSGRNVVRFDGSPQARERLIARLGTAGLLVERSEDWLGAGDFVSPLREAQEAIGGRSFD